MIAEVAAIACFTALAMVYLVRGARREEEEYFWNRQQQLVYGNTDRTLYAVGQTSPPAAHTALGPRPTA